MTSRRRHRIVDSIRSEETIMTTHTSRPSSRQPAVVTLDREAARVAIRAAAGRFTALLRETNDIERPAAGTD
jgi:hypothetical protein